MASFSFGAGNARKLLTLPLYALGRLATAVIPRRDHWVVASAVGVADGPLALAREAREHGERVLWLTANERQDADAAAQGFRAVRRDSLRGFLATARAGVVVVSHGFGDANRYAVSGAFIVQLWHGIPLKRIGLDSPETTRIAFLPQLAPIRALLTFMYRGAASRIRVLPAASHLVRGRLESAFGLPDSRIVVTGEPRVDVLSAGTADERRARADALLCDLAPDVRGSRVLYAPTWRDGADDPAVPTAAQWRAIIDTLDAHDATLLVRSHPLGGGAYRPPFATDRVRMLGSDVLSDVTPVLPAMDVLITDYSSLAFDAGLVPLPVLFLAPDVEAYARTRGFYGRYADVAGDDVATTWEALLAQLAALFADPDTRTERVRRSAALSARVHAFHDGHNTRRVYREIERRRRTKGTR